jgi:hypothetical protein
MAELALENPVPDYRVGRCPGAITESRGWLAAK